MSEVSLSAAITLDIDWAPDFVIDAVAARLLAGRVHATWFVTHQSPAVDRLRDHGELFELGLHPNFLPGSSQGADAGAVVAACMAMVPGATSMRTHALMQSTPLLELVLQETSVRTDVSIFLPHATGVAPIEYWWLGRSLTRIPYVWEDDFEIERPQPVWDLGPMLAQPGVRVFDFHPIHVYLNSSTLAAYQSLKRRVPVITAATPSVIDDLVETGAGAGTAFNSLIAALGRDGGRCISDLAGVRS